MDTIIRGGAVKALGNGRVAGYLIQFSNETTPDLSPEKDFFTAHCDFGLEDGMKSAVYYAHALDPTLKNRRIGQVSMKQDDVGIWVEGQLSLRDSYEKAIYSLAEKGALGWSSGTASHLVTRKAIKTDAGTVHEILSWPLSLDASLTPTPADHRNSAYTVKSLQDSLVPLDRPLPTNHTKALPAGMSYDDLQKLLSDELNEDFPDDDDPMGMGMGMGLMICAVYDDAVVYCDCDEPGDLMRRTYTITPGLDVVWGPEESVVRVTTYATATDGDDDSTETTSSGDMPATMKTSAPPAGVTFENQLDAALDAVKGVIDRGFAVNELRIKSGRVISAANRAKLREIHGGMQTAHAAMAAHMTRMDSLLSETDPQAKKDADEFATLRMRHERIKAQHRIAI